MAFLIRATLSVDKLNGPIGVVVGSVAFDHFRLTTIELGELIVIVVGGILHVLGSVPDYLIILSLIHI